jgi:hypothetical protein
MHGPINVKSPYNIRKWQMGFNSAFKGLKNASFTISKIKLPLSNQKESYFTNEAKVTSFGMWGYPHSPKLIIN